MRRIEEAHKFELVLSIKALVARALADEVIEGVRQPQAGAIQPVKVRPK